MDEIARRTLLFDFYGPLLTVKQQEMFDLYYQQDLSLGEIAEIQQVTRPAVYDILRRAEDALNVYESKLSLVRRYIDYCKILKRLREEITRNGIPEEKRDFVKINSLLKKLEEHW